MARSRIGPREPVERPADLHASVPFPPMEAELVRELQARPRGVLGEVAHDRELDFDVAGQVAVHDEGLLDAARREVVDLTHRPAVERDPRVAARE